MLFKTYYYLSQNDLFTRHKIYEEANHYLITNYYHMHHAQTKMKKNNFKHHIIYKKKIRNATQRKYLYKNLDLYNLNSIAACFFTKPINFKLILITTSHCTTARNLGKNVTLARKTTSQDRLENNIELDPLNSNKANPITPARTADNNTQATSSRGQKVKYKGYQKLHRIKGKLIQVATTRLRLRDILLRNSTPSLWGTPPPPARPASPSISTTASAPTCWPSSSSLGRYLQTPVVLRTNGLKKLNKAFIYNTRTKKTTVMPLQLIGSRLSKHLRPHPRAEPQQGPDQRRPRRRRVHRIYPLQGDNHHSLDAAAYLVAYPQFRSP